MSKKSKIIYYCVCMLPVAVMLVVGTVMAYSESERSQKTGSGFMCIALLTAFFVCAFGYLADNTLRRNAEKNKKQRQKQKNFSIMEMIEYDEFLDD